MDTIDNPRMVTALLIDQNDNDAPLVREHHMLNYGINESIAAVLNCQKVGGLHHILPGGDVLWFDLRDMPPGTVLVEDLDTLLSSGRQLITGPVYKDADGYHVQPPALTVEMVVVMHMASCLKALLH